jgi:DNA-binding CsgD family transcriptional regulator
VRHAVPRSLPLSFIEEASAPEVAELIVEAYALTERERAVTALVCQGCSTRQIAGRLFTSEHTVQDHLNRLRHRSAGRLT